MMNSPAAATLLHVRGVVQGVGFRPFVCRLAQQYGLRGWVRNGNAGVEIHIEGSPAALTAFARELHTAPPPAAAIATVETLLAEYAGYASFDIVASVQAEPPDTGISADLPVCDDCLRELADPADRRFQYPCISCTHCGPRYSIITALPYDRMATTMASWELCARCAREYGDPADRRYHAQTVACHACGPAYTLVRDGATIAHRLDAVRQAATYIARGGIVAIKGIGGYHLACDAHNVVAVGALRSRKYRKEKPFAIMVRDVAAARTLVELSAEAEALLCSVARPIVLARARIELPLVAPDSGELGVLLPYSPVHHLLFAFAAPAALVMTSGNRSSEPVAYHDEDALVRLDGIADAFLIGDRAIARRVDDSVVRAGALGPQLLRRSRGYAPAAVARVPFAEPILALGADLKNTIALAVGNDVFVSQHIGDLEQALAARAFEETAADLLGMYEVDTDRLVVVHDLHPEYASTRWATQLPARAHHAVQHQRAHVASVLAERGAYDTRVLGIAFDGTGYGDDGSIWGGEFFAGSLMSGFERVAHLRPALLVGGDAAARSPVQAAAGFLAQLDPLPDMAAAPFRFPQRYTHARQILESGTRIFSTTSIGRLFDTVAALLGYTRDLTYEAQAALWLEQLAAPAAAADPCPFMFGDGELDFRTALLAVIEQRRRGRPVNEIARAFHIGLAQGVATAARTLCDAHDLDCVVLTGGVFQNDLLLHEVQRQLAGTSLRLWTNQVVPANDGGISLGQVASLLPTLG